MTPPKPNKYALRDPPDFRSKFLLLVDSKARDKENQKLLKIQEERQREIDILEKLPPDNYEGRRVHAWVVVICKIVEKPQPEGEEEIPPEPEVYAIEPSTGFKISLNDPSYLGIESIWNHQNYYVNRQEPITNISNMKWILSNTEHWEHLLPGEPYEARVDKPLPPEIEHLTEEEELAKEKHLDMPFSWVDYLYVSQYDYEERYPSGEKIINYKYAIDERFAPYKKKNGLMRCLTYYETLDYQNPHTRWEWYENREDLLEKIKIDFREKEIDETFAKGRSDFLKCKNHIFFHYIIKS